MWRRQKSNQQGILLVEIVLAVAVFGMIALVVISAFVYGREANTVAGDNSRGAQVANTAIEALHNIAQSSFSSLNGYTNGTPYYLSLSGSQWAISSSPTLVNNLYTPSVVFGTGPNGSRSATVTVTWQATKQRQGKVTSTTYLIDWQTANQASVKTGLLIYANGGTTTSLITYRLLQSTGGWTAPQSLPSVGASNRVARSVKLYTGQTGTYKMVMARLFNGTTQYLYGFYWNGSTWATPQLLASWNSNAALDSGNFSGTWLANGTFVAVYSDSTNRPKYRTFSAGTWSNQGQLDTVSTNSGEAPTSMIVRARPGTNEAMLALLAENYDTLTSYFSNNSFSSYTTHANSGTSNGTHNVDFDWSSSNKSYGALVYTRNSTDRTPTVRIFTANGSGSGSWGTPMTSTNQPTGSIVLSVAIAGQVSGGDNFMVCDKDSATTQKIYCYTATPTSMSVPANPILAAQTTSGGAQTMELGYEDLVGNVGLAAYTDNSNRGQVKRFFAASNSWDANPLSTPLAAQKISKTRLSIEPGLNDAMVMLIDDDNNLYTNMYSGDTHTFYTTPAGYNWTVHNANGPSTSAKWFDFGWDN